MLANNLGYLEGSAIKYITRWKDKNGIDDIRKAIHFLEKLIEVASAGSSAAVKSTNPRVFPVQDAHGALGIMGGLRNPSPVPESAGFPNLNTEAILRPDNV